MSIRFTGGWNIIIRHLDVECVIKAKSVTLKRIASFYERQIKLNIESGGALTSKLFTPIPESTIRRKRSSKPLIDTGEMLNAIKAEIIDENTAFVGIKSGIRHGGGKEDTAQLAAVHEFGAIIPGGEVPARPFIRPVLEDEKIRSEAEGILKKIFDEEREKL